MEALRRRGRRRLAAVASVDERPAPGGLGRARAPSAGRAAAARSPRCGRFQRSARSGANVSLVTSPGPDEVPQRVEDLAVGPAPPAAANSSR